MGGALDLGREAHMSPPAGQKALACAVKGRAQEEGRARKRARSCQQDLLAQPRALPCAGQLGSGGLHGAHCAAA